MKEKIINGASELGITVSDEQAEALCRYYDILIERNRSVNLTRITEPDDVVTKHFLDSLTPLASSKKYIHGKVIDVGTGAGFPGLVLKCCAPDIELTLLDSLMKRVSFLKDAAEQMGITSGISFIHARAEDAGHDKEHRERYDAVVSRAVANMRTLSEWCLPFVKKGGYFLALKGPLASSELDDASGAIKVLGGELEEVRSVDIPGTDLNHKIVIIKKVRHTPSVFARKGGKSLSVPAEKALKTRK